MAASSGLIPGAGGGQRLMALAGRARAMRMVLTGEVIDADTAFGWGIATHLADGPALDLADLMRWRRDVRRFRTDPVPEDLLARGCGHFDVVWLPAAFSGPRNDLEALTSAFAAAAVPTALR